MTTLHSTLNPRSDDFKANTAAMQLIVDDLHAKVAQIAAGGGAASSAKHVARGKLLPRDRVQMLLDPGTPFLEFSQLAAFDMYKDAHGVAAAPAAGIITGIGRVVGQECVIVCNDATVKGGTYYPMTVKKHLRAQEIADQNNLPCIYAGTHTQLVYTDPMAHAGEAECEGGRLTAPMPGKIVAIHVKKGDVVVKGAPLLVMEAMKMEHTISAPSAGVIEELLFEVGDQVADGTQLLTLVA